MARATSKQTCEAGRAPAGFELQFVRQVPQLGTGHAVQQAVPLLADDGTVLVLSGDVPLIAGGHAARAGATQAPAQRLALLTIEFDDPTGYGRIVRDAARRRRAVAIVEQKDATPEQRAIREVYSGIMAVPARLLKAWLARLDNRNAQGEYYLTDIVGFAVGRRRAGGGAPDRRRGCRWPASTARRSWPRWSAPTSCARRTQLMEQGVRLADPARIRRARHAGSAGRTSRSTSTACSKARCRWATACASARTA